MRSHLHVVAEALGVPPALQPSQCAVCGDSPFDAVERAAAFFGPGWSDHTFMARRSGEWICAGCRRILGGKPGSTPTPLRMRSCAVVGGVFHTLDLAGMWSLLAAPPDDLEVLSWAQSGQKHHLLRAGRCLPTRLVVGCDEQGIVVDVPATRDMVAAVQVLRSGPRSKARCTRQEIVSGGYRPATIAAVGADAWAAAESAIAPWRGHPVLDLYVAHCPVSDAPLPSPSHEVPMLDPIDEQAVQLLGALARHSRQRLTDPMGFWGHFLLRRVQRHTHRNLNEFVSRLMQDLAVEPVGDAATAVAATVATLDDAAADVLMRRLDANAPVLVALAYDRRKQRQESVA